MRILITGGSSDIALAIAQRRQKLGDQILITSSTSDSLSQTLARYRENGIETEGFVFNFSNPSASTDRLVEELVKGIDAIVLNAFGRLPKLARFHESNSSETDAYLSENILANFWLIRQVLPHFISKKFGRIILISSLSSISGTSLYGVYCAAKAALEGLMFNLAVDYGADGVTANILRLGLFKTSRTALFWRRAEYRERMSQLIPQAALGEPAQAAEALDGLLSQSSYMNGSVLTVSGGLPLSKMGSR